MRYCFKWREIRSYNVYFVTSEMLFNINKSFLSVSKGLYNALVPMPFVATLNSEKQENPRPLSLRYNSFHVTVHCNIFHVICSKMVAAYFMLQSGENRAYFFGDFRYHWLVISTVSLPVFKEFSGL